MENNLIDNNDDKINTENNQAKNTASPLSKAAAYKTHDYTPQSQIYVHPSYSLTNQKQQQHSTNPSSQGGTNIQSPLQSSFSIANLDKTLQQSENAKKVLDLCLSGLLYLIAIIFIASPLFRIDGASVTRISFVFSDDQYFMHHILGGRMPEASYWVTLIFHTAFLIALVFSVLLTLFGAINKKKNRLSGFTDFTMSLMIILMLISVLIGMNFVAVFSDIAPYRIVNSRGTGFVVFAVILFLIKLLLNLRYKPVTHNKNLEHSNLSISTSFVLFGLNILALYVPLYIFPGRPYRLNGSDIITGGHDILHFLPTADANRTIITLMLVVIVIAFIVSLIAYLLNKKIFIQLNKITMLLGIMSLIIYVLIGINYLIIYNDTRAFEQFTFTSWDTYAYIPLLLFGLYLLGTLFAKFALSKVKTEIVYVSGGGGGGISERNLAKMLNRSRADSNDKSKRIPSNTSAGGAGTTTETPQPDPSITNDPIPAFTQIDAKEEEFEEIYKERLTNIFYPVTLHDICVHVIEYARSSKEALSYSMREIKSFIAGLSFSRFSILQGLSGTGKTSLPKIVMSAIDGNCELIAVESSWRDKNELLGYYNEFNKKFTPKAFTEGLYKASLNPDIPTFIVLDEMNLSRVEYYFSDFLSILEHDKKMQQLKLFDVQLCPVDEINDAYLSLVDGNTLEIPANVWFVGTANRDESTFEISDKVYDRANTLNFDKRAPKPAQTGGEIAKKFLSYNKLLALFEESKTMHFDAESNPIVQKVEMLLAPYKILLGNRVIKQIESFVKVYVSCSSDKRTPSQTADFIHEALDCILLSKLVRKLEFRQAYNIDALITSFKPLKLSLCQEFLEGLGASLAGI